MGISLGDQVFVGDANPDAYVSAFNAFDRLMFFIFYLPTMSQFPSFTEVIDPVRTASLMFIGLR